MKILTLIAFVLTASLLSAAETYELKIYHLKSAADAKLWDGWMSHAGLRDLKQSGATQVGAFKVKPAEDAEDSRRFVLAVYPSTGAIRPFAAAAVIPRQDDAGAEAYLGTGPKEAPYTRVESSLLTAVPGFSKLMDPAGDGGKDRYFELRTYENPNERAAALKVEMFGKGGEIAVFNEVGLKSVFYGSARIAQNLPQLTYMVVHENEDAAKQAWSGFGESPSWAKLKKLQRYKGTVSKIYKHMLVALPFSELK
jgi:hypothetical protein